MFEVTTSRKWHEPEVRTVIDNKEIALSVSLKDFITALKIEIGSVRWVVKQGTFETMLDEAVQRVLLGVQEESAKVMGVRELRG
jgi:Leu/Phe-tRNA-protein transferase